MAKGIIALDIDGTLTNMSLPIPAAVLHFLTQLSHDWKLIFITGRTFSWAHGVLQSLQVPYALAVQNGAAILQMPERKLISKRYLSSAILPALEEIYHSEPSDYVLYSGFEHYDRCFYRPSHFDPDLLHTLLKIRVGTMHEEWQAVESFQQVPLNGFASAKGFGLKESAERISQKIEERLGLHAPVIRDPLLGDAYIIQATHPEVDKGKALSLYAETFQDQLPRIAAGDDRNDLTMFAAADYRIVMETAPQQILAHADIIAPSADKQGILVGLQEAIRAHEHGLISRRSR